MDTKTITRRVASRDEWLAARAALLEREKQHTRMGDELAQQRRELPWVAVDKPSTLQTADGPRSLAELFDGRSQLLIYHFMFGPSYGGWLSGEQLDRRLVRQSDPGPGRSRPALGHRAR